MQEVFAKIIERLEEEKRKGHYDFNSVIGEKNVWKKAIEIVKQSAEEFGTDTNVGSNGWISVSERLPEKEMIVWVSFANPYTRYVKKARYSHDLNDNGNMMCFKLEK